MNVVEEPRYRSNRFNQQASADNLSINGMGEPIAFKSVLRIASIISCISKGISSVTDIATACKLNKSTVYRLLRASEKARLTTRNPFNHRYFLGPLITEIASNPYVPHEQLVLCAIKDMTSISEYSRESIGLHVLNGFDNMLLVHEIPSLHDIQIVAKNRIHTGLHTSATSKALLSQVKGKILKTILDSLDFIPITKYSITNKEELKAQLKEVKRRGYAVDFGEKLEGVMCLSVPINNYVLPSALSILGPESRVKPRMDDYIDKLLASGLSIQKKLSQISPYYR